MKTTFNIGQQVWIMDTKPRKKYIIAILEIKDNEILYAVSNTNDPVAKYQLSIGDRLSRLDWKLEHQIGYDLDDLKEKVFKGTEDESRN